MASGGTYIDDTRNYAHRKRGNGNRRTSFLPVSYQMQVLAFALIQVIDQLPNLKIFPHRHSCLDWEACVSLGRMGKHVYVGRNMQPTRLHLMAAHPPSVYTRVHGPVTVRGASA